MNTEWQNLSWYQHADSIWVLNMCLQDLIPTGTNFGHEEPVSQKFNICWKKVVWSIYFNDIFRKNAASNYSSKWKKKNTSHLKNKKEMYL